MLTIILIPTALVDHMVLKIILKKQRKIDCSKYLGDDETKSPPHTRIYKGACMDSDFYGFMLVIVSILVPARSN